MSHMLPRYQPSGQFNPTVFVYAGLCAVGVVLLAWPYQWMMDVLAIPLVTLIYTVLFAMGTSILMNFALDMGSCRNRNVAMGLGVAFGLVAVFASHHFAYSRFIHQELNAYTFPPTQAAAIKAELLSEHGYGWYFSVMMSKGWKVFDSSFSGLWVLGCWLIEGGLIVWWTTTDARDKADTPYCEACGMWASLDEMLFLRADQGEMALHQIQSAETIDEVIELPIPHQGLGVPRWEDPEEAWWLVYMLQKCPGCDDAEYLTVSKHWKSWDDEGNESDHEEVLQQFLYLEPGQVSRLRELADELAEGMSNA